MSSRATTRLRVAVDASELSWGVGGIARYLRGVLPHLVRDERLEIVLATNAERPVTGIDAREVAQRVRGGPLWRSTALLAVARGCDLLWCPQPLVPLRPSPARTVVTVHDLSPLLHPDTKPVRERLALALAGRRGARRADRLLSVSLTTARDLEQIWGISSSKVDVVPLAVDDRFRPGDRDDARARVSREFGVTGPFALVAGTIEPRKGLDLLTRLAPMLDLPVVLAGSPGPRSESLLAALRPHCVVLGRVDDDALTDLYRAAEVLLAPSRYEGFGLTPLEAMACGTPAVVAAGAGALEEVSGEVALVVPREAEAWRDAVRRTRHERAARSRQGMALARRRRWSDVAAETAETLLRASHAAPRR